MLRHYLVSALRRFARRKLYSAVSVIVLALGVTCFVAAYLFADYLRHYDRGFPNAERIYYVAESIRSRQFGIDLRLNAFSALPLADQMRLDMPELARVARVFRGPRSIVVDGEPSMSRIAYAEDGFLEIFGLDSVEGDARGALSRPGTAVVTQRTAERLFGGRDAVGKTFMLNGSAGTDVTIAAVIRDAPTQSHLASEGLFSLGFDIVVSWDVFEKLERTPALENWGNTPVTTYIELAPDSSLTIAEVERRLAAIVENHVPRQLRSVVTISFAARPIAALSAGLLQLQFEGINRGRWPVDALTGMLLLAGALLVVACVNFVNLATAEARGRAFDIGSRKALGASRAQIVSQELVGTALRAGIGIAAAVALMGPARFLISDSSRVWRLPFAVPWTEPRFWLFLAALLAAVTLVAGLYPALVLSRLRPLDALRLGRGAEARSYLRNLLVGIQFATAAFLVAFVVVLVTQRDTLRETLLGRYDDPYVGFFVGGPTAGNIPADVLVTELERNPAIKGVAAMMQPPFAPVFQTREFASSRDENATKVHLDALITGYDYFDVMQIRLLAGRVFSRDRADDAVPQTPAEFAARGGKPVPLVVDRSAARALGWADPAKALGAIVYAPGGAPQEVVGVVESVPQAIRASEGAGVAYLFNPRVTSYWLVRIDKSSVAAATAHIDAVMKKLAPDRPPPGRAFLDVLFANAYWTFALTQSVLTTLALFALAIAAVGSFGMASYTTTRRTREIGLRKSQGAKARQILTLLLWDYSKPALWASIAAFPLAYVAIRRYLELFANRAPLTPLPFAIALLATLLLAAIAVSGFVLRAAYLRPAAALRAD
jgi:putative ABC transport system permease protein